jgi:hypothetical protein
MPVPSHCHQSKFNTPNAPATRNTQPLAPIIAQRTMRCPANIAHLIITPPTRTWSTDIILRRRTVYSLAWRYHSITEQIPNQHKRIVCSGSQSAASRRRPFDAVYGCCVAVQFEKSLPRLSHVKNTDDFGILREGGEEMGVVRRGGEAEEGRCVGHCLLG